jgi:hypothetical protein
VGPARRDVLTAGPAAPEKKQDQVAREIKKFAPVIARLA